ncbi:MAG: hypothetical protein WA210_21990 [Burkholderiaceae bacterium]
MSNAELWAFLAESLGYMPSVADLERIAAGEGTPVAEARGCHGRTD